MSSVLYFAQTWAPATVQADQVPVFSSRDRGPNRSATPFREFGLASETIHGLEIGVEDCMHFLVERESVSLAPVGVEMEQILCAEPWKGECVERSSFSPRFVMVLVRLRRNP